MDAERLAQITEWFKKRYPQSRIMAVKEVADNQYEIAVMDLSTNGQLLARIDRHTELK